MRLKVLQTAAHALWDHTTDSDGPVAVMRQAAEIQTGIWHGVNDCAVVGAGTCDLTGVYGDLIEVERERSDTKIKTSDLTGAALDWAVAKCEGRTDVRVDEDGALVAQHDFDYSTDWAQGGPLIEREGISLTLRTGIAAADGECHWEATYTDDQADELWDVFGVGETALIAAMRCYVVSKLGAIVDVPEGLRD